MIAQNRLQSGPLFDDDYIAIANSRFDRIYPRDDGYFTLPQPDWMDPVSPLFDASEPEPSKTIGVWLWLRRGQIIT